MLHGPKHALLKKAASILYTSPLAQTQKESLSYLFDNLKKDNPEWAYEIIPGDVPKLGFKDGEFQGKISVGIGYSDEHSRDVVYIEVETEQGKKLEILPFGTPMTQHEKYATPSAELYAPRDASNRKILDS